jgi:hypothetical protein
VLGSSRSDANNRVLSAMPARKFRIVAVLCPQGKKPVPFR